MSRPAIHPGEIPPRGACGFGVTPTELARQLKAPANRITQIIQGKRSISGDTALRLDIGSAPAVNSGSIFKALTTFASPRGNRAPRSDASPCVRQQPESTHDDQPSEIDHEYSRSSRRCRNGEHFRHASKPARLVAPSPRSRITCDLPRALGRKTSDEFAVPLCRTHHRLVHKQRSGLVEGCRHQSRQGLTLPRRLLTSTLAN